MSLSSPPLPISPSQSSEDRPFRRMIVISTAVSLAAAYGWLAGFVRQPDGDLVFHWRWLILLWTMIGLASTLYFWRKVWPIRDQARPRHMDIVKASIALCLPGVWWLIFPLRSLSGEHFRQVAEGLVAATLVLSFGAWMLILLAKGLENDANENSGNENRGNFDRTDQD